MRHRPSAGRSCRLVVLVSGTGSNLAALIDACADPAFGAEIVAVGADRAGIGGLEIAEQAGLPTFVNRPGDHADRAAWDRHLAEQITAAEPDLIVSAGFMRLFGPTVLTTFHERIVNTH
ncbi:MAG: phosphoribosylglycinamide formyltransferase, partial [Jiangellaceae bacterium]